MEVIKLPKKFRMVCYDIMDGKDEALNTLETFSEQFPHQVAAVKAEVAYFNMDYNRALDLDLTILPYLEEWYYSNVSDQHMIAMAITSVVLHREEEVLDAFRREQERIRAENGWQQRDRYCDILMNYIRQGQMPFADDTKNHPYNEPEEAKSKEQLWKEIQEKNKKLTLDSVACFF